MIGVGGFFWIGYEDRSTLGPILFGGLVTSALSLQVVARFLSGTTERATGPTFSYLLLGLSAGALAMPLAALSMLVKVSLHGHVPPDFSAAQVLTVLERTPVWSVAGALAGSAAVLAGKIRSDQG
jgi:hypothetical protein